MKNLSWLSFTSGRVPEFMKELMLKFSSRVRGFKRHGHMLRILVESSISSRTASIHAVGWTINKHGICDDMPFRKNDA
jgi:hypothetical protein